MSQNIIPEFHQILHGGDYNPDQWQKYPEILEADIRLMKLSGCNTFSMGIFAWSATEPEEGHFTLNWLDTIMDRFAKEGLKAILATPSGSKPAWMSLKYPEIRRVDRNGVREPHRSRHNHCWSSPIYREKVRVINTVLAKRYGSHPALGLWHVSNEYGGECMCELCIAEFHRWLERKYGTLDNLNHAWWSAFWNHTFSDWKQIHPAEFSLEGLMLDWVRFNNWQIADYFQWEARPLREFSPGIPVTTNFMGTHPTIDYSSLASLVDVVADDQYPGYDCEDPELFRRAIGVNFKADLYRSFKPGKPWFLMESCPDSPQYKRPCRIKPKFIHQLEMLQALGAGAEGVCYFQWRKNRGGLEKFHGAVVDHEGSEKGRIFQSVCETGKKLASLTPILGSTVPRASVAVVFDWDAMLGLSLSDITRNKTYEQIALDHYQPYIEAGVSVDVISSERDFSGYKVLILPQLFLLKPGVAARIRAFVEQGGIAIATHYTGIVNETNLCLLGGWPGDGLRQVFGIWNEETDELPEGKQRAIVTVNRWRKKLPHTAHAVHLCAQIHLEGAEALAHYDDGFYKGGAALTRHSLGEGAAYYFAAQMPLDFLRAFHAVVMDEAEVTPILSKPVPTGVLVQKRTKDNQAFLFLSNFTNELVEVALGDKGWTPLTPIGMKGQKVILPAFGSAVLEQK
ncbi:MAG: beta-galactosidase [Verrucomicrobiota bacterium]|nr:beta-galactosidase [Verrucomicrobiota bacterium]